MNERFKNMRRREITNTYYCTGSDGGDYLVDEYTDFIALSGLTHEPLELEGRKNLKLEDGSAVRYVSAKEFQIVSSGIKLRVKE
jgi:uncharacterized protein YjdB